MRRDPRRCFALAAVALALAGGTLLTGNAHGAPPPVQIVEPSADIMSWLYEPKVITVGVGDSVTWKNVGAAPHAVTSLEQLFDSGLMNAGDEFAWTFSAPGAYEYICIYHPWMTGTVVVGG